MKKNMFLLIVVFALFASNSYAWWSVEEFQKNTITHGSGSWSTEVTEYLLVPPYYITSVTCFAEAYSEGTGSAACASFVYLDYGPYPYKGTSAYSLNGAGNDYNTSVASIEPYLPFSTQMFIDLDEGSNGYARAHCVVAW